MHNINKRFMGVYLALFSNKLCTNCMGRTYLRDSESVCITCGRIQYQKQQTIAEIKRPENLNEWVLVDGMGSFRVYYVVKDRSLITNTCQKGTAGKQPYASCTKIIGPYKKLRSNRSAQLLCKAFYKTTGLKLKNVPITTKDRNKSPLMKAG